MKKYRLVLLILFAATLVVGYFLLKLNDAVTTQRDEVLLYSSNFSPPPNLPSRQEIFLALDDGVNCDEITNLKIFRDDQQGFEFQYPCELNVRPMAGYNSEEYLRKEFVRLQSGAVLPEKIFFLEAPPREIPEPSTSSVVTEGIQGEEEYGLTKIITTFDNGINRIKLQWGEKYSDSGAIIFYPQSKSDPDTVLFDRVIDSFTFLN